MSRSFQIPGSAVAIQDRAVLIIGSSRSGKSALAISLIARGAELIGDDIINISAKNNEIWASPHENAKNRFEVRGIGIVEAKSSTTAPIRLIIDMNQGTRKRLPEPEFYSFGDQLIPKINGKGIVALTDYIFLLLNERITAIEIE